MATVEQVGLAQTYAPIWEGLLPKVRHRGPFSYLYPSRDRGIVSEPKPRFNSETLTMKTFDCLATTMADWYLPEDAVSNARATGRDWRTVYYFEVNGGRLTLAKPELRFGMYLGNHFPVNASVELLDIEAMVTLLNRNYVPVSERTNILVFNQGYSHVLRLTGVTTDDSTGQGIFFAVDNPGVIRPARYTQRAVETLEDLGGQTVTDHFLSLIVTPKV